LALARYVIDGNAPGVTAPKAFKQRNAVDSAQPDSVVISAGHPLTDRILSFLQRAIDFRPPLPVPQDPPSGADDFINEFIGGVLRPWVRSTLSQVVRLLETLFTVTHWAAYLSITHSS